jgi:3-deoxy-7-phosphoheptulonate synthase
LDSVSGRSIRPGDLDTWRALPTPQQPDWPDPAQVRAVAAELAEQPPLVFTGECDQLKDRLAAVAAG